MNKVIVSKAPFRISLAGGGTDLISWCSKFGGQVIGFSIDRYVFTTLLPRNFQSFNEVLCESNEVFSDYSEIKNQYLSFGLQKSKLHKNFKASILSDAPAKVGLGSSAAFLNSLIYASKQLEQASLGKHELAELSSSVEIENLQRPVGKQDHYLSALGGVNLLTFERDNSVIVEKVELKERCLDYFNNNLMLFYTNIKRSAGKVLLHQSEEIDRYNEKTIRIMKEIKKLVKPMYELIINDDPKDIGLLLSEHWNLKKLLSRNEVDGEIEQLIELCYRNGADGCKILGAGGGGFILVSSKSEMQNKIRTELEKYNIRELRFNVDFNGATVNILPI